MDRSRERRRARRAWLGCIALLGLAALCAGALVSGGSPAGTRALTLVSRQQSPGPSTTIASATPGRRLAPITIAVTTTLATTTTASTTTIVTTTTRPPASTTVASTAPRPPSKTGPPTTRPPTSTTVGHVTTTTRPTTTTVGH